jgi:hypothetical protein
MAILSDVGISIDLVTALSSLRPSDRQLRTLHSRRWRHTLVEPIWKKALHHFPRPGGLSRNFEIGTAVCT